MEIAARETFKVCPKGRKKFIASDIQAALKASGFQCLLSWTSQGLPLNYKPIGRKVSTNSYLCTREHCPLRYHKMGLVDDEEIVSEDKTRAHDLCNCQALAYIRHKHLGSTILTPEDFFKLPWKYIMGYFKDPTFLWEDQLVRGGHNLPFRDLPPLSGIIISWDRRLNLHIARARCIVVNWNVPSQDNIFIIVCNCYSYKVAFFHRTRA